MRFLIAGVSGVSGVSGVKLGLRFLVGAFRVLRILPVYWLKIKWILLCRYAALSLHHSTVDRSTGVDFQGDG